MGTGRQIVKTWLAIAAGGAIGAMGRYAVGLLCQRWFGEGFPVGTLVVNVSGCFLIGIAWNWTLSRQEELPWLAPLIITGFLGAWTTFSTFGHETLRHATAQNTTTALANVAANLICGLAAAWGGAHLGRLWFASSA